MAANIDPYDLSIISQRNCPLNVTEGVNINIDDDTFSTHNVAGVVRKAGEKVGDGIEYVAGGAKELYHKYNEKEQNTERNGRYGNPDAEWLP